MELERKIAEGKCNEVYQSGDAALKVFKPNYPKTEALSEALIVAEIEDSGLNIPKIRKVTVIDDNRWAIVMDYIPGKTLLELMKENPDKKDEYIELLVDLQIEMHKKTCKSFKNLREKLYDRIQNSEELDNAKKYELETILDGMPKHKKLCHGDFTPQNIIISETDGKPYIMDWNHASIGNASADIARSYLWLSLYMPDMAEKYMKLFCEKTKTPKTYVQKWLPVVAAGRLYNHIPEEKATLMKWIDVVEYE